MKKYTWPLTFILAAFFLFVGYHYRESLINYGGHCGCIANNGGCDMPCSNCCLPGPCKGAPTKCCK